MAKKHRRKAAAEKKHKDNLVSHKPLYGLMNQGATCYLNSVLQVLFMTTELRGRLEEKSKTKKKTDRALREVFEKLKKSTCGTKNITDTFHITDVYQQRDASECLEMILNNIDGMFSEVFRGELTYTTICSKGHRISLDTNPFWTLPLSLSDIYGSYYSVEKGFEIIFQTTTFSGDNMVYCEDCEKKTEATSGCEMKRFPQILILLLKRFDFDYITMSHFKSNRSVDIPSTLQTKNKQYELYAIVNHMGSLRGGHYTATVLSSEDKAWYEFNDSHVQKVGEQLLDRTKTRISNTAYLLMYRAQKGKAGRATENKETPKADGQKKNGGRMEERREPSQKKDEDKPEEASKGNRDKMHTVIDISETPDMNINRKPTMKQQKKGEKITHPNACSPARIQRSPYFFICIVVYSVFIVVLLYCWAVV
ncbi:ubiquitin carboxyl-terminal hydrolase 47-like [Sphaeramia orbicularis]|uniref:ubiquitin carboxyl-terminal hydrolase 47-like n=1 Tax=Sphaeramia orbicularis TaxID=375764 RepID=UPI00117CC2BE|nr:ubiquitin carboxyl-terminal hydrolase 47-like [Sphaeramia orbicularis]